LIKWLPNKSYRVNKKRSGLFQYSEGVSSIPLNCGYCKKDGCYVILKVTSKKGSNYSKICSRCGTATNLTIKERRKIEKS